MGVFSGSMNTPEQAYLSAKNREVCKRDYEGDIEALKVKATVASQLFLAIEDYCDTNYSDGNATFTLNGLIGGLTREIKSLNKSRELLIEEWEREKGK